MSDNLTEQELDALVARLTLAENDPDEIHRNPDLFHICRDASDALTALRTERDVTAKPAENLRLAWPSCIDAREEAEAERDELRAAIFGSGNYCKTLRNGNFVEMAQATEAGRKAAIARAEAAETRVVELEKSNKNYADRLSSAEARLDSVTELNMERAAALDDAK